MSVQIATQEIIHGKGTQNTQVIYEDISDIKTMLIIWAISGFCGGHFFLARWYKMAFVRIMIIAWFFGLTIRGFVPSNQVSSSLDDSHTLGLLGGCNSMCEPGRQNNGICDLECFTPSCEFDYDDCVKLQIVTRAGTCNEHGKGYVPITNFEECEQAARKTVRRVFLIQYTINSEMPFGCSYQMGVDEMGLDYYNLFMNDHDTDTFAQCSENSPCICKTYPYHENDICKCSFSALVNGVCDPECNTESCNNDNGSCLSSSSYGPPVAELYLYAILIMWVSDLFFLRRLLNMTVLEVQGATNAVTFQLWDTPWECYLNNENEAKEINAMLLKCNAILKRHMIASDKSQIQKSVSQRMARVRRLSKRGCQNTCVSK